MQTEWLLPPSERTVPAVLRRQGRLFGDRPCVSIPGAEWRHSDLAQIAARRASALQSAGITHGDRVAIMCLNRAELLEAILGCAWIGAVAVPINCASMAPQIEYLLVDSAAQLLVIESQYLERLEAVDLKGTSLRALWVVGDDEMLKQNAIPVAAEAWPAPGKAIDAGPVLPSDTFAVLYTSGTTGPSKGVLCSHAHYYWWGVNTADVLGHSEDDVLCTTLPLFHINALHMFMQAAVVGCKAHYLERFSASGFWPAMVAAQATVIYLLGAMVPFLLAQPLNAVERAHRVRVGLGPGVPEASGAAFLERTGVLMVEGYGATETNLAIAASLDSPRRGVMGWLRPGFEAQVADEFDNPVADGEAGELLLRATEPFAFASGYLGKPEKTVEAWRNLWFHTGDRVIRDPDGAFRFIDRIKDAIRRRGENISSWEVEQAILSHPAIAACAVYPVRSEHAEDEVMAAVVKRPGHAFDPVELAMYCGTRLQKFAVPRFIDLMDELPRTENGKVQKYLLRERGVPPGCWDSTVKSA